MTAVPAAPIIKHDPVSREAAPGRMDREAKRGAATTPMPALLNDESSAAGDAASAGAPVCASGARA